MKYHIEFDLDFKRNQFPGLYIALEGINASGKSTQVERIKDYFQKKGKPVVITSEPNDALKVGKMIRQIINEHEPFPSVALQYLYSADRVVNHQSIILPALQRGEVVISSRNFWSAVAYGMTDVITGAIDYKKKDHMLIAQGILSMYHQFTIPDTTCFLDISIDVALDRISKLNNTRDIYEKKEKLVNIAKAYELLLNEFSGEIHRIDGEQDVAEITRQILSSVPGSKDQFLD